MPVNDDKAQLNTKLGAWFLQYCPEYLEVVTGAEFHALLRELISLGDILLAAKRVEEVSGAVANEALIVALVDRQIVFLKRDMRDSNTQVAQSPRGAPRMPIME
jgi:hypothetical protein